MNAERIVHEFGSLARPVMREFMTAASCIAAARTTIEVMRRFGLKAYEVPVSFIFYVPARNYARTCGFTRREREAMRARAANWRDDIPENGESWNGHLIVIVEDRWMIDPAIDQAACEELGVSVSPQTLIVDTRGYETNFRTDFEATMGLWLDNGDAAKVIYRRIRKRDYRKTEAWNEEALLFLAERIAVGMQLRLEGRLEELT